MASLLDSSESLLSFPVQPGTPGHGPPLHWHHLFWPHWEQIVRQSTGLTLSFRLPHYIPPQPSSRLAHSPLAHLDLVVAIAGGVCCLIPEHLPCPAVCEGIPDAGPFPVLVPGTLCLVGRTAHTPGEACRWRLHWATGHCSQVFSCGWPQGRPCLLPTLVSLCGSMWSREGKDVIIKNILRWAW